MKKNEKVREKRNRKKKRNDEQEGKKERAVYERSLSKIHKNAYQ